jgi:fumarate reductase subunit C
VDSRFPQKQNTSEKLKARQYGAAGFICLFIAVVMTVIRFIWGGVMLGRGGDRVSLGMVIFLVRNLVLIFGVIDLISAAYHSMLWNRNGRKCMDDDDNSLFSDWKSGERSPVKVSLALIACIVVLALLIVVQG